jgi:hypothetical protein
MLWRVRVALVAQIPWEISSLEERRLDGHPELVTSRLSHGEIKEATGRGRREGRLRSQSQRPSRRRDKVLRDTIRWRFSIELRFGCSAGQRDASAGVGLVARAREKARPGIDRLVGSGMHAPVITIRHNSIDHYPSRIKGLERGRPVQSAAHVYKARILIKRKTAPIVGGRILRTHPPAMLLLFITFSSQFSTSFHHRACADLIWPDWKSEGLGVIAFPAPPGVQRPLPPILPPSTVTGTGSRNGRGTL